MKRVYNGLFVLVVAILFLTSCGGDDGALAKKITIDGVKVALSHGYVQGFGSAMDDNGALVSEYGVILTSDGMTIEEGAFVGTGTVVLMQLVSPSSIELRNGTYTINIEETYLKNSAFSVVAKNYDASTQMSEAFYEAIAGTIQISKSGSTFKITFNLTLSDDVNEVQSSGSYEGKLEETYLLL